MNTLNGDGEKDYVHMVYESAKAMWGHEAADEFKPHIEATARAVYAVSNHPMQAGEEPATKLRHGDI